MSEDEHGNLSMVEEPAPEKSPMDVLEVLLGAAAEGVLYTIYDGLRPEPLPPVGTAFGPAGNADKR